jgi:cytochrome P450
MHTTNVAGATPAVLQGPVPSGPRGNPVFGLMADFMRDSLGFLERMRGYGPLVQYRTGPWTWYQVNDPAGVQRVLQENNRNYSKGSLTQRFFAPIAGDGLFVAEGESWLSQRRLMQPGFHRRRVAGFGDLMIDATRAMLDRWQEAGAGARLDVAVEMTTLTAEIVTAALFSTHVSDESRAIAGAITTLLDDVSFRFKTPFYPPPVVPTPRNRRQRRALRTLDRAMYGLIAERRRQTTPKDDLLAMLLDARDADTGRGMSDKQLRDEVVTLFVAGHETTATALTWTLYLLSQNPDAERRLQAEVDSVLGGRALAAGDLPALPYTRMVIDESMRLYPPAWITSRQARGADVICGYPIPAGAFVQISPYAMHRNPAYWDEPTRFLPERFAPERAKARPPYAYFPFGGGPRICIGKGFALMEAALVLAAVAQQYRLRLAPGHRVEPETLLTLRPRGGMPMILEPRRRAAAPAPA